MEKGNYGKGSIYRRQDGRWMAAVCSRDPAAGKSIRHDGDGKTQREALQKRMDLLAQSKGSAVIHDLTAKSI